ncbi:DUF4328 domain-containing protein [Gilvimarinus agarilyticus]|uniref:DUF4328 domain-containing protein n=1 Tax=Gilvimarinus sp. 2_MG-2023 TaxID=3062666 RepID=UPI001C084891|nr:DUF4328 domain-containing protein [Gilvimarinus sp. 2_MG-2023]MBU2887355.1 DUF4328 domain-containing protein [Gilvimarinus agarilyticus]MDO6572013.1 DUF4328 domain-containing protein [Gilvimarinus sp. 2_MG-2023]
MSNNEGFRDSSRLTSWVRYILYAQIIVAVLSLVSGNFEYQLLSDYQDGIYTSQEQAMADGVENDQRQRLIGIVYFVVFFISMFLILRWIHRANHNARQLGAENMRFSSGWSIGYYFIPILTLWKPYQAMKEIWKASKEPSDWESQEVSSILPIWWALWLVSNFLGQALFRFSMKAEEIPELLNLNIIYQVSDVIDIALALALLAIVKRIYSFQSNHVHGANDQV